MLDFLLKGLVYVPAFMIGKALVNAGLDPFDAGWIVGCAAVITSATIWPWRTAGQAPPPSPQA
jgi:hypothetical protein